MQSVELVLRFVKEYMLGSQFGASWFLGALIVATPIVSCMIWLSAKIHRGGVILLIASALSVYIYLNECENSFLYMQYEQTVRSPKMSCPVALPWLIFGICYQKNNMLSPFYHGSDWEKLFCYGLFLLQ